MFNEKERHSLIKCLGLLKGFFFTELAFLSTLTSVDLLSCISMNNQECRIRPQVVNINSKEPFFPLVLRQLNAAVVETISIIHMQNCAFLILLKI